MPEQNRSFPFYFASWYKKSPYFDKTVEAGATSWDHEAHGWRVTRTGLSRVDAVAAGSPDPTAAR